MMVLTKAELIGSLQNEVRILLHLVSKMDKDMHDYRPTPKQRSTLELLQYLSIMGPELIKAAKAGTFDVPAWTAAEQAAKGRDFDQTVATISSHRELYPTLLGDMSDDDFRTVVSMFGSQASKGAVMVNMALSGYAAYRTQLFLYLKACGREELGTMNLWGGMGAPPRS